MYDQRRPRRIPRSARTGARWDFGDYGATRVRSRGVKGSALVQRAGGRGKSRAWTDDRSPASRGRLLLPNLPVCVGVTTAAQLPATRVEEVRVRVVLRGSQGLLRAVAVAWSVGVRSWCDTSPRRWVCRPARSGTESSPACPLRHASLPHLVTRVSVSRFGDAAGFFPSGSLRKQAHPPLFPGAAPRALRKLHVHPPPI